MILPVMFHWSPSDRRDEIRSKGLIPFSDPVTHSGNDAFPYICLSPSPSCGWALSGDMDWVSEIEKWDLWQVVLDEKDEIHYRSTFGNRLEEIKVYTAIPADRVWYVGTRVPPEARSAKGGRRRK